MTFRIIRAHSLKSVCVYVREIECVYVVHTRAEMAVDIMGIHHPHKQWGCLAFELSGSLDANTHTQSKSPISCSISRQWQNYPHLMATSNTVAQFIMEHTSSLH